MTSLTILSVAAALTVSTLTPVMGSEAAWLQNEWDHGAVGTLDCPDPAQTGPTTPFKTRGAGRLLGGEVLSLDLDAVAGVNGQAATNNGAESTQTLQNPLDVTALSLIQLPVFSGEPASDLDQILGLTGADAGDELGVVNEYAQAVNDGSSAGASGAVSDSGVVLDPESEQLPGLGTFKLSTLVKTLTGQAVSTLVGDIADVELEIGAVASRATLDACDAAWTEDLDESLTREYAIAGLDLGLTSPTVQGLTGTLTTAITGLESTLNSVLGQQSVITSLTSGVDALINSLGVANVSTSNSYITVDLSAARALTTAEITDPEGLVLLDLATGHVSVDLAALFRKAYGGSPGITTDPIGLNQLPPNTLLAVDGKLTDALIAAIGAALTGWVGSVETALTSALSLATAHVELLIALEGTVYPVLSPPVTLTVAEITVAIDGSLQTVLDGNGTVTTSVNVLDDVPLVGDLVGLLVDPLIDGIVTALVSGSGTTPGVAQLVGNVLKPLLNPSTLVAGVVSTLNTAVTGVTTTLSPIFAELLGSSGLLSVRFNVQNDPDAGNPPPPSPLPAYATYDEWESGSLRAVPDGRYDVGALSITLVGLLGVTGNVNLELARSSVGISCAVGGALDRQDACADY